MINDFVKAWNKNKDKLQEYFETTPQSEYDSYEELVKLLFDIVINPYIDDCFICESEQYNTKKILVIDDGHYQGTQIFILHKKWYQPSVENYVYTSTYYGSCSGCDTLLSISGYGEELPSEKQVKDYMTLCLHLMQGCKMFEDSEEI